jgi:acetolactate decarboxylase
VLDRRLVTAVHVEALRRSALHAEHERHVLFQASTIGALLDGAYEGDVTFAELAEHGDAGLGTLNALDGEMIAVDGRFFRADVDGKINEVDPTERTPFAVVVWFEPRVEFESGAPLDNDEFIALLERTAAERRDLIRGARRRRVRAGPGALGSPPGAALPPLD